MYLSLSLVGSSVGRGGVLSVVVAAAAVLGGHYLTARCDKILSVHSGKAEEGRDERGQAVSKSKAVARLAFERESAHGCRERENTERIHASVLYSYESSLFLPSIISRVTQKLDNFAA